jgi:hypothetical protein
MPSDTSDDDGLFSTLRSTHTRQRKDISADLAAEFYTV